MSSNMHEKTEPAPANVAAAEHHGEPTSASRPAEILQTPIWILAIRIAQILISVIILGLSGTLAHDAYIDEFGLGIAVPIVTWLVVGYLITTEKIPGFRAAYHIIAVLCLEAFMVILWLATFAAIAAKRAQFKYDTTVSTCYDDGSTFDSLTCLRKRGIILFESGQNMMSAAAGLSALVWVLFLVSFIWTVVMFVKARKAGRFQFSSGTSNTESHQMQTSPAAPAMQPQPTQQPLAQNPPVGAHQHMPAPGPYAPQGQYPAQGQQQQQMPSPGPYAPQGQYPAQGQQQQQSYYPEQGGYYPTPEHQTAQAPATSHWAPTPPPQGSELAGSDGYGQQTYPAASVSPPPQPAGQQYHQ